MPAISKIISKVILDRIKDHLYSTIDREQAGFRPGSSCVDHINTLRLIIEQSAEYRSGLHFVFVDFEKAFNSVDREVVWMALRRRGIPNKIVAVLNSAYNALVLNGHPVQELNQFTYLGSEICKDCCSDADVDCRVRKAKRAFGILSPIWRNSSFPNSLKVCIFKINVVSVLLYGSSTWKVTKSITTKLQVFVNRCLRRIFHIY